MPALVAYFAMQVYLGKLTLDEIPEVLRADVRQYMIDQGWLQPEVA